MALIPVSSTASTYFEINNTEAIRVQKNLIKEWEPKREVWPLRYGEYIMGITAGINGLIINSIFRKKLKVLHHGLIFTTASLTITPLFITTFNYNYLITNNFLLYNKDCLACEYLKAISIIQLCGIIYPITVSPMINLTIAGKLGYRVPYMTEVRETLQFWWNAVKPASNRILILSICNSIIASLIVYKQSWAMDNVMNILLRIQKKIDDGTIILKE
ncbi:Transmembrane protein 126A [Anthophora quadrimaculata]